MARRGGDPYSQGDYTNDSPYGTTPDPYGTTRQTVGTQPVAGGVQPYRPPQGSGANPGSAAFQQAFGGNPSDPNYLSQQQALYNPGGLQSQYDAAGGDNAKQFQAYLAGHPNDPQAAIDAWMAGGDPGGLKPAWESGSRTIGLANGTYLVAPGTGGNSGTDWQTVQRTGTEGGSGAQSSPFLDTFRQGLLDRLKQLQAPTDPNSAAIAGPTAAYDLSAGRGLAKTKQAQAQAAYAGGSLNTGGYQQAQTQADEQAAADKANFSGNLVNTAEQSRQSQLNQLLGLGSTQGTNEELAGGQLGYAYSALKAQMDRDAILAALGGYGG